jgi:hypothetical protein
VTEHFKKGEDRFYPMELLEIVKDTDDDDVWSKLRKPPLEPPKKWLDGMFAEISTDKKQEETESSSTDDSDFEDVHDRAKCSQTWDHPCMQGW